MSVLSVAVRKSVLGAFAVTAAALSSMPATAATTFENNVSTAIDRGLNYLATAGAFNLSSSAGEAAGLTMLALLEKRASGIATDPPQGYSGASAADKARLRNAAAYILNTHRTVIFDQSYRDGAYLMALAEYAVTDGPDKSQLISLGVIPAAQAANYDDIKTAMNNMLDRLLAYQHKASNGYAAIDQGYWCYYSGFASCNDSSTTQFAAAGLNSARIFYQSVKAGDQVYADPTRLANANTALSLARTAYELNAMQGSDYGSAVGGNCAVMNATERGHGYNARSYMPSLAQTASGIYIQLFGGANINTPMVQNYMQWLRHRYRYTDLDSMGNSWPTSTWSYYMWSSFKAMEIMRLSTTAASPGNLKPSDLGNLATAAAPLCNQRQVNKDPALVTQPANFGGAGAGVYNGEQIGQYFDYAHQILTIQCANGNFTCGSPGYWNEYAHNAYLLLVLLRSSGRPPSAKCDADENGQIDTRDLTIIRSSIGQFAPAGDLRDANSDGVVSVTDYRACTLKCTKPACAI